MMETKPVWSAAALCLATAFQQFLAQAAAGDRAGAGYAALFRYVIDVLLGGP
jgi:hypothetical protein